MKIRTRDVILYSPYDNKVNNQFIEEFNFNDDFFYTHFFEPIREFENVKKDFDAFFDLTGNESTQISILSGYSGCGKTTFIHDYKRKIKEAGKNYYFKIINLIKKARGTGHDVRLIVNAISDDLIIYLTDDRCFDVIVNNWQIFSQHFRKNTLEDINKIRIDFVRRGLSYNEKKIELQYFLNDMDCFGEILLLYFVSHILLYGEQNYDRHIFCFDNLDELNIEYLSVEIWDDIMNVLDILRGIFADGIECNNENFIFNIEKLSVLFVMREANISITNAQLNDRITTNFGIKRMILGGSVKNILQKRYDFIENNKEKFKNIDSDPIYQLLRIIKNEKITEQIILPALNFDYRKLFQILLFLTDSTGDVFSPSFFKISYDEYSRIFDKRRYLARGILYNGLILFMIKTHFENFLKEKDGCRPSRLFLTVLNNLCYPLSLDTDTEKRNLQPPQKTNLYEYIKNIENKINVAAIIECLNNYFTTSQSSWAHFITVYNIKTVGGNKLNVTSDIIEILNNINNNQEISNSQIDKISKIELLINASGHIYLRYLITHFEYFSHMYLLGKGRGAYSIIPKPLVEMLLYNHRESKFEFEIIINEVFKLVADYESQIKGDFENKFRKYYTPEEYLRNDCVFSFKPEHKKPKSFYMSRVITTHITYLDDFRYFILHDENFKKYLDNNVITFLNMKNIKEINKFIVGKIKEYIKLAEEGIPDHSIKSTLERIKRNIKQVEDDQFIRWIRINPEEGEF